MRKNRRLELVRVLTQGFLVNSAQHACRYETNEGSVLAPGYYLALGPGGVIHSTYGRDVRFFGPFETATVTRFLKTSAEAMDIAEKAEPVPPRKTSAARIGQDYRACDVAAP